MMSLLLGSFLFYFLFCSVMTLKVNSKKSLKRLSNDELLVLKQECITKHAFAKKNGSYGAMGHAAEVNYKIDKELRCRGVLPMTIIPMLRLVEDSKVLLIEEINAMAV